MIYCTHFRQFGHPHTEHLQVELEDLEAGDAHREPDSGSASRSACSEKRLLDAATDSSGSADSRRRHVNSEGNNGDGL